MGELGYFENYSGLMISIIMVAYLSLYVYLTDEYGSIDE